MTASSSSNRLNHYFALDYRDMSTRSKKCRLSLSSIAVPCAVPSSFVNDGSDYNSWLTSGWGSNTPAVFPNETNNIFAPPNQAIKHRTTGILSDSEEYRRRKEEWAKRYTSLNGLRRAFGTNRNKLWGDLDAATTRKLYKSLLPNALCELVLELGVDPEELAPLAYQARKAAKLYARERCQVPARIASNLYDGFRQWKQYGRFQPSGMSYEQLWDKYYHQQLENHSFSDEESLDLDDPVTKEEIVSQTCQKILEKACTTNEMIDKLVLGEHHPDRHQREAHKNRNDLLLKRISRTLQRDVRKLLDPTPWSGNNSDEHEQVSKRARPLTPQEYHALKLFALARRNSSVGNRATGDNSRHFAGTR